MPHPQGDHDRQGSLITVSVSAGVSGVVLGIAGPPIPDFSLVAVMALTLYCSQVDLTNRLSADGITYRTDDTPPTSLRDALGEAATIIDEHCRTAYDPAALAASDWVRHRATDIAAWCLTQGRGNPAPPGVQTRYERTMKALELVRVGSLAIPDIAARRDLAPVLSNMRIRLDPFPRSVVEPNRSSSRGRPKDYAQNVDSLEWFDYSI